MKELRAAARVTVSWRAEIVVGQTRKTLKVFDISETGLGLVSDDPFTVGQEIDLRVAFPLPDAPGQYRRDLVRGEVRYLFLSQGRFNVGLRFSRIEPQTQELIRNKVTAAIVKPSGTATTLPPVVPVSTW